MKTRIVQTKIWQDTWFDALTPEQKLIFLYLITNERVNLIHCFEINQKVISLETGLSVQKVQGALKVFLDTGRIGVCEGYIYLRNASKYETYEGPRNDTAKERLIAEMSPRVRQWFLSLKEGRSEQTDTPINTPIDTSDIGVCIPPINHKSKINIMSASPSVSFDTFWKQYPRKEAKQVALKSWQKLQPDEALLSEIMSGLQRWQLTKQWREGIYPHASTWLNQRRWEDELTVNSASEGYI